MLKPRGASDDKFELSYVTNECAFDDVALVDTLSTVAGNIFSNIKTSKTQIHAVANGYSYAIENGVNHFTNPAYSSSFSYIQLVNIYGLDNKLINTEWPIAPSSPTGIF